MVQYPSPNNIAYLSKAGISSTFPRVVLFGPEQYGCLGNQHPFYLVGVLQLITIVEECVDSTQTGALIYASMVEILSDVGFNFTYQTLNWKRTSEYINECWYSQFLHFIQETQIK